MKKQNPKTLEKARELENIKEAAKDVIFELAEKSIDNNRCITDTYDLGSLVDDLEIWLEICEKIDNCKSRKNIPKIMKEYCSKREIGFIMGV